MPAEKIYTNNPKTETLVFYEHAYELNTLTNRFRGSDVGYAVLVADSYDEATEEKVVGYVRRVWPKQVMMHAAWSFFTKNEIEHDSWWYTRREAVAALLKHVWEQQVHCPPHSTAKETE